MGLMGFAHFHHNFYHHLSFFDDLSSDGIQKRSDLFHRSFKNLDENLADVDLLQIESDRHRKF